MKKMPYYRKKMAYGFLFITPWLIGFILFFLAPFLQSCSYAFQTLKATPEGMVGEWIGLENFRFALFRDTDFLVECANSLKDLITVPLILVYSICFALLLKKEYPGRTLMRAIAFLPVIIGSGVLMDILKQDVFATTAGGAGETMAIFSSSGLSGLFTAMGLPENIVNLINQLISKIFDLTWRSGVQILLFLAGLHNIPDYVYEAAEIEGANALQVFFKITLPMLTPMILVNWIYTIIDQFARTENPLMDKILTTISATMDYGYASSMAWIYCIVMLALIGGSVLLISRMVYYYD